MTHRAGSAAGPGAVGVPDGPGGRPRGPGGWDWDAGLARMPELPGREAGRPLGRGRRLSDLVIDPLQPVADHPRVHRPTATELDMDKAVGYEAAYAGTSFATRFDQLGACLGLRVADHARDR